MNCLGCKQEVVETVWGNWCDTCGGVVLGEPPKLFFRHVATVDGGGGRFPIIYDTSAEEYGVTWPRPVHKTKCIHCGQETPVELRKGLALLDDLKSYGFNSARGTLNQMIALIQPHAQGTSEELPSLSQAPTATEQEAAIIQMRL